MPVARTIIAMVDAHRAKVSTRIQITYEPIDGIENEIGGCYSIQSTEYKPKTKN